MFRLRKWLFLGVLLSSWSTLADSCPDLDAIYRGSEADWSVVGAELEEFFDQCLLSSEYFALLGAAQLNTGRTDLALESLERALLLDPNNGAALIDYGQTLFNDGQLFAALELSAMVIDRDDVPEGLREQLLERDQFWRGLTRQTIWQLDLGGGYDNNLNGAPSDSQIALTLSGEPVFLNLNDEYRADSGEFFNAAIASQHTRLAADIQHSFFGQLRGRFSENEASDLAQFTGRYSFLRQQRRASQFGIIGVSHLTFSQKALFTGTDIGGRFQIEQGDSSCDSYLVGALQHQIWHTQRRLDGVDTKVGIGANCVPASAVGQAYRLEANIIKNFELREDRLGGNREGWQILGQWQRALGIGVFSAQAEIASILDGRGYSDLLDNNSRRRVSRGSMLLQYRQPQKILGVQADVVVTFFHQERTSNLDLFDTTDTSIELGLSLKF